MLLIMSMFVLISLHVESIKYTYFTNPTKKTTEKPTLLIKL